MREIGRKMINPAHARKLRPWIKSFASDVVARVEAADHVDLVEEVALRLPLELICEALGMRGDDVDRFHAWSSDVGLFAGRMSQEWDPETQLSLDRSLASWLELESMFRRLMDEKRRQPEDDILTELVRYFDNGTVSEEEVIGLAVFFLAAGHGTSRDLIASALYLLLTHPSEATRLAAGPSTIASAVEEVLRYESPIPVLSQLTSEDVTFAGETVHAGESVLLHLGSANRDSAKFDRAEVFDVTRTDNRHLAFGYGGHFCLGAPLARETATAVLEELEPFLSHLVLDPAPPQWRTGDFSGRSLTSLNASWSR
jgi:cytochrome P450